MREDFIMNKYTVTATWRLKLLALAILLLSLLCLVFLSSGTKNALAAFIPMFVYTLLFISLAVEGSENRFAIWLSKRKIFTYIFFMPTLFCPILCLALAEEASMHAIAFAGLLPLLSIPYAFMLLRFRGGLRKKESVYAYLAFPIVLYVLCFIFAESALPLALGLAGIWTLICIILSFIQFGRDHKADYDSSDDKSESRNYEARWDGHPLSDVKNNVIHIRGKIIVEYWGDFYQNSADSFCY